jgi:hypothetical protein
MLIVFCGFFLFLCSKLNLSKFLNIMNKTKTLLSAILFLGVSFFMNLQAQCPTCTVSLPPIPVDTVYLDTFPVAQQNVYFEEQLSFRLPMTTTPLIGLDTTQNIPAGIALSAFTVTGISGLPVGLSYDLDRPLPATYNSSAPTPRDGCITICGTPRQAGVFTVNISVLVETGILAPQPATIPLEFIVLPDTSASFSMTNSVGCAPLTVSFNNNVSPDSSFFQSGAYNWNFGNGQNSTAQNPGPVIYSTAGTYTVDYQAVISTPQTYLASVVVTAVGCNDNFIITNTPPDLFLTITGSSVNTVTNYTTDLATPVTFSFGTDIPLTPNEVYEIFVQDSDELIAGTGIPGPADCGRVTFNSNNSQSTFNLNNGQLSLTVTLNTVFNRDTFNYSDVVTVQNCNASVSEIEAIASSFNVYPNPTSGLTQIQFQTSDIQNDDVAIKVIDVLGRNVAQKQLGVFSGTYNADFDFSEYGTGVYIVQLQVGNNLLHRKVVVR